MLHPLRYKLNKTWTLNYYSLPLSLSPPSLPTSVPTSLLSFLPTSLHPSLHPSLPHSLTPLTPSSSDPPSSVSASHYIYPVFLILSHSSLLVYTPLPPRFRPPLVFCTHSLILIKAHMDSVMAICTHLHERRSYLCHTKQLCNTCHASLTLSQFKHRQCNPSIGVGHSYHSLRLPNSFAATTCNFAISVTCTWLLFL